MQNSSETSTSQIIKRQLPAAKLLIIVMPAIAFWPMSHNQLLALGLMVFTSMCSARSGFGRHPQNEIVPLLCKRWIKGCANMHKPHSCPSVSSKLYWTVSHWVKIHFSETILQFKKNIKSYFNKICASIYNKIGKICIILSPHTHIFSSRCHMW